MIRLTSLGKLFLVILGLLYGASLTSQSGLLLFLIGLLLGCFCINVFAARGSAAAVHLKVPARIQVAEGERLTEPWDVINSSLHAIHNLEIRNLDAIILLLSTLPPKARQGAVPNLFFSKRGVFPHSKLRIISTDPFGLLEAVQQITLPGEILVHPAVYECAEPRSRGFDVMVGGKHKGAQSSVMGSNFAGVRAFQPGDPFKQIHWQSSAKGLDLMVKTFDEELSGRVAVVLDTSPSDARVFDAAVRAAGSLAFAALEAGHHVEWMDLNDPKPLIIPPFADSGEILDRLARLNCADRPIEPVDLTDAVRRLSRRSALHMVFARTAGVSPLIEALLAEGRVLSVYFPETGAFSGADLSTPEMAGEIEIFGYTNDSIIAK